MRPPGRAAAPDRARGARRGDREVGAGAAPRRGPAEQRAEQRACAGIDLPIDLPIDLAVGRQVTTIPIGGEPRMFRSLPRSLACALAFAAFPLLLPAQARLTVGATFAPPFTKPGDEVLLEFAIQIADGY